MILAERERERKKTQDGWAARLLLLLLPRRLSSFFFLFLSFSPSESSLLPSSRASSN